ncbi:MAG: O-methyltransferase [Paenibacillaceae bacterium]|jgi:predicted O-methyltransferase YrrM|nr:O-methyltransferase [Paenibacillaceae bacterium]
MKESPQDAVLSQELYIESLYQPDADLERVRDSLRTNGIHDISVAAGYGRLLTLLVRISGARNALEIGALGGYSGICIARGLPESGRLLSLELNPAFAELARHNMAMAGLDGKAEYAVGEAAPMLHQLREDGRSFDFFFIDADKGNYPDYLELAIALSTPGALIAADNLFLRGRTMNSASQGHSASQLRRFNEQIAADPRLESALLPAYDGLALARVKG